MIEQKLSDQARARPKKARFKPDAEFDAAARARSAPPRRSSKASSSGWTGSRTRNRRWPKRRAAC